MTQGERDAHNARRIFIPLATASIIWGYVDEVLSYCAAHKLRDVAKLSREVKQLRQDYDAFLAHHLDKVHRDLADAAAADFRELFAYDLLVMYCTLSNELSRKYAGVNIPHDEMRVRALCGVVLRRALFALPEMVDLPGLHKLDKLLTAYVAPFEMDLTGQVETLKKILAKRLAAVPDMECKIKV